MSGLSWGWSASFSPLPPSSFQCCLHLWLSRPVSQASFLSASGLLGTLLFACSLDGHGIPCLIGFFSPGLFPELPSCVSSCTGVICTCSSHLPSSGFCAFIRGGLFVCRSTVTIPARLLSCPRSCRPAPFSAWTPTPSLLIPLLWSHCLPASSSFSVSSHLPYLLHLLWLWIVTHFKKCWLCRWTASVAHYLSPII